jgi:Uma2 family endonuclease
VAIVSPRSRAIDRQRKIDLYARHGVPHYWIVDFDTRAVEAYVLVEGRYALGACATGPETFRSEPLPDLEISLATLWP